MAGVGDFDIVVLVVVLALLLGGRRRRNRNGFVVAIFQSEQHIAGKGGFAPGIVLSKDQQDIAVDVLETIVKVPLAAIVTLIVTWMLIVIVTAIASVRYHGGRPHNGGKGGVASVAQGTAPNLVHLLI